jgi:hypothetical protein
VRVKFGRQVRVSSSCCEGVEMALVRNCQNRAVTSANFPDRDRKWLRGVAAGTIGCSRAWAVRAITSAGWYIVVALFALFYVLLAYCCRSLGSC